MYSQEGNGNGQREQEVTSPTHYIFEQFQNSYQFRTPFTNPEKIFELLCPFMSKTEKVLLYFVILFSKKSKALKTAFVLGRVHIPNARKGRQTT